MPSWRLNGIITTCPECGEARIKLAREKGRRLKLEERVYYCPKCHQAFSHEDLVINYPRANNRVRLALVREDNAIVEPPQPDQEQRVSWWHE